MRSRTTISCIMGARKGLTMLSKKSGIILTLFIAILGITVLVAQQPAAPASSEAKQWTTQEDHQNMMTQLGIKKLRPGPSGNEKDPNHANYDESLANPYPESAGSPDAEEWEKGHQGKRCGGISDGRRSWRISSGRFWAASPECAKSDLGSYKNQ